jgi:hypothetical protein
MIVKPEVTRNGYTIYKLIREDGTDVKLSSITTILGAVLNKPYLIQWAVNLGVDFLKEELVRIGVKEKKLDFKSEEVNSVFNLAKRRHTVKAAESGNLGTKIHVLIDKYIRAKLIPKDFESIEERMGFYAFMEWAEANKFEPLLPETTVYHDEVFYTGEFDCVGMLNGKKYLIDFKISPSFYDEMGLQLEAGAQAYERNYNDKIEGIGILRLDRYNGLPEWKDYTSGRELYWEKFKYLANYYNLEKGIVRLSDKIKS